MTAVGVDGCRAGWLYCRCDGDAELDYGVAGSFGALVAALPRGARVLVDMPIGLLESGDGERGCDREARRLLSPGRGSSVFPVPCRQAVYAADYAEAAKENRRVLGRGLSRQSWNICGKIREVDALLTTGELTVSIRESHPELCFRGLAGRPMGHNKKTREGIAERLAVLDRALPGGRDLAARAWLEHGGFDCARDDVIDAAVLLACARHWDRCTSLPEPPRQDPKGLPMEIVHLAEPV